MVRSPSRIEGGALPSSNFLKPEGIAIEIRHTFQICDVENDVPKLVNAHYPILQGGCVILSD